MLQKSYLTLKYHNKTENPYSLQGCDIWQYSSNKIRKTQNEHLNIVCQNLNSQ